VTARTKRLVAFAAAALACALGAAPAAEAAPFVVVDASLHRGHQRVTIRATVRWNVPGIQGGMRVGDLRAVAVDARTTVPTLLAERTSSLSESAAAEDVTFTILDRGKLVAMHPGNRVVLTATQHPPPSQTVPGTTRRSYVTVAQLSRGPSRGRVGSANCSSTPIGTEAGPTGLRFCDLVGAVLEGAVLSGQDMRMADLTGGVAVRAGLSGTTFDGGRLSGVDASQAQLASASMVAVTAPRLVIRGTHVPKVNFLSSSLDGSRFDGSTLDDSPFTFARLNGGASFADTTLVHVDFAYARLRGASFERAQTTGEQRTSFFMANLEDANLRKAVINPSEERETFEFAILCRTLMPLGLINNRDCKRRG
jgi:uncharacterized protein YjbI with pentapeptide repeats